MSSRPPKGTSLRGNTYFRGYLPSANNKLNSNSWTICAVWSAMNNCYCSLFLCRIYIVIFSFIFYLNFCFGVCSRHSYVRQSFQTRSMNRSFIIIITIIINNNNNSSIMFTRALQPVATCGQLPYLRPVPKATKPAIIIVTSFALWRHSRGSRFGARNPRLASIPTMTSLSLWRHTLLSWPRTALRTCVRTYGHLTAFNICL